MDFLFSFFFTSVAYADFDGFLLNVNRLIVNPLIVFMFALAIAFFLFGVLKFLMNQENEDKKTEGKQHMLWGIVGITIMMGVFTILKIVLSTLDIGGIDVKEGKVQLKPYNP